MQNEWQGKKFWIAGSGVSGRGAYEALTNAGAQCAYWQDDAVPSFAADAVIVSPGIDETQPVFAYAQAHDIPVWGELELGARMNDKPIVAVTGTNGKTTVTELIASMLRNAGYAAVACGNVGASFALAAQQGGYDYAVVEASSFQLETVRSFAPHVAVITNISPDHLNRHKTMQRYCAAKRNIAAYQTAEDYLILSQDDIPLYALEHFAPKAQTLYTSVRGKLRGAYVLDNNIWYCGEAVCETDRVRLEGEHNVKNALSAVCAVKALGIENAPITETLTSFTPDAHRLHLVARKKGKNYYNDSKGTNVAASLSATACMCGDTCMIVGGSDKGYEYDELFARLPACVVRMAAVGETAPKIAAAAARHGFTALTVFDDFVAAVAWASDGGEENVLLSPASASFDLFSSYIERGETFERLVRNAE